MFSFSKLLLSSMTLASAVYASPIAAEAAPAAEATPPPGYNSILRCELMRQGSDRQRECYLSAYGSDRGPTPTVIVYPNTQWQTYPVPRETIIYDDRAPRGTTVYGGGQRPRETVVYGNQNRDPYRNDPYDNRDGGTVIVYQPTRPAIQATVPIGYQAGPTIGAPNWN